MARERRLRWGTMVVLTAAAVTFLPVPAPA
jgi:hypothetical protein